MKQKKEKSKVVMGVILAAMILVLGISIFGMSKSISQIKDTTISKTAEALLASAGLEDGADISLAVSYWDQRQDECVNLYDGGKITELKSRQFEWTSCGYGNKAVEQGLVEFLLSDEYLPVAQGGKLISNRGMTDIQRWFTNVDGKSKEYSGKLRLEYKVDKTSEFVYEDENFYPLDEVSFSDGDSENVDGHNHLFTMSFSVPFMVMASGEEEFMIRADDDTFVFVGEKLALDMGGIHDAVEGRIKILENGEVYTAMNGGDFAYSGITVENGKSSVVRIFHADRDAENSEFSIRFLGMNLQVMDTELAEGDGIQIAYDPNDPSYVAPLGESIVFRPDGTRGYIIMMTIFGVMIVVFSVFVARLIAKRIIER